MRTAGLPLLLASASLLPACTDPAISGDDVVDPVAGPGLDRCAADGVALEQLWSVDNLHGEIVSMAVAPDGTVVLGTADGAVKQWDVGVDAADAPLEGSRPSYGDPLEDGEGPAVRALAIDAGGGSVLGGDAAGGLRRWAVPGADFLGAVPLKSAPLTAVLPRSAREAVIADDSFGGAMRVVDLEQGLSGAPFQTALWGVTTLAARGDHLYTAGHDYQMAAVERRLARDPGAAVDAWDTLLVEGWVRSVGLGGDWLVAAGDGFVVVLGAEALAAGPVAEQLLDGSARAALTPSGEHVAIATATEVSLWTPDLATEVERLPLDAAAAAVALDPSTERLLVAGADGRLRAYGCR
jgi:hypothetical protein